MKLKDIPGTHVVQRAIPAEATAGDTDTWSLFKALADIKVTAAYIIYDAGVTGAATNNYALAVRNEGTDGTGTTAVTDTLTFDNGEDATAQVPKDLTVSTTEANVQIDEGETVSLVRTINGTGLASPDGVMVVEYEYR